MTIIPTPSPNFDERDIAPDLIVLHYTGMIDGGSALMRLTDPAPVLGRYRGTSPRLPEGLPETPLGRVSAHYLVEADGRIFALVDETKRAWHAGVSHWAGADDINARSIGIEIVNGGHDHGLPPFPDVQIEAVTELVGAIRTRWGIPPHRVVGHSDIAPGRKQDPGEHFPWARLAAAGHVLAPRSEDWPVRTKSAFRDNLAAIGYRLPSESEDQTGLSETVIAFQRRYRPTRMDGVLDDETLTRIADIAAQCRTE